MDALSLLVPGPAGNTGQPYTKGVQGRLASADRDGNQPWPG
jgi:hypothetical protein